MPYYLIYHPRRAITEAGGFRIHHDRFGGNEDPYIWNAPFLHTFCHITQLPNEVGQVNFWVSSQDFRRLKELRCDCVFVVGEKIYWSQANYIDPHDPIVDNHLAFRHHYQWVNPPFHQHPFRRRARYTLKATLDTSFQPQTSDRQLIDILPFLATQGLSRAQIKDGITATRGAKPMVLGDILGQTLYQHLWAAPVKLLGEQLSRLHPNQ